MTDTPRHDTATGRPAVMIVDPRPDERQKLADAVRHAGFEPVEAATPLEAIHLIEQDDTCVAAAAVRDQLTQTAGAELIRFLAEQQPSLRFVLVTDGVAEWTTRAGHRRVPVIGIDGELTGPVRTLVEKK